MNNDTKPLLVMDADTSRKLVLLVVAAAVLFSAASLLAHIYHLDGGAGANMAVALFSVDEETSIPTWWATMVLAVIGLLVALTARTAGGARSERLTLYFLAAGFLALSVDEAAMLHERAGYLVEHDGALKHARWMMVWLPLAAAAGVAVLWMIWQISRSLFTGLLFGAIVFLGGALVMEAVNSAIRFELATQAAQAVPAWPYDTTGSHEVGGVAGSGRQSLPYILGTAVEELLEMLGAAVWLSVVLDYGLRGQASAAKAASAAYLRRRRATDTV